MGPFGLEEDKNLKVFLGEGENKPINIIQKWAAGL